MIVITILVFILILSILVLVHELGHFILAKRAGVKVEEFSFGFPPRIFSFKRGETRYSLGSVPFGGYVKMLGEEEESLDPRSFAKKKVLTRLLIVVAGVFSNFLLAVLFLILGFKLGMTPIVSDPETLPGEHSSRVVVLEARAGSPAEKAGITSGEVLAGFKDVSQLQDFTKSAAGKELELQVENLSGSKSRTVKAKLENGEAPLGVTIADLVTVKMGLKDAIVYGTTETFKITGAIFKFLGQFFQKLVVSGKVAEGVTGPVGIFSFTSQAVKLGFIYVLQLVALISVNLALINLLPFPALDGSKLVFLALEGIRGKKVVDSKIENTIHLAGFIILILLILAITYRDIQRLIVQ